MYSEYSADAVLHELKSVFKFLTSENKKINYLWPYEFSIMSVDLGDVISLIVLLENYSLLKTIPDSVVDC